MPYRYYKNYKCIFLKVDIKFGKILIVLKYCQFAAIR